MALFPISKKFPLLKPLFSANIFYWNVCVRKCSGVSKEDVRPMLAILYPTVPSIPNKPTIVSFCILYLKKLRGATVKV